ncbi:TlyA family RNA methyltransferase [Rubritalea marina]|uniref:TlyA family RNA methyltransferase n=1 Tax=Rubritalea marina TaxID=361055 RepID=UPI000371A253|nr:TlyA family RNA methyltransferase [Rubritalea marina]
MKDRADAILVARKMCDSREQAKRLILAGEVMTGTTVVAKPSTKLSTDAPLEIKEKPKYVSRGGLKLEGALKHFGFDPTGMVCLDCGASTGGFTDCLLQAGAVKVHAIDVGTNQLVWKIRSDDRVVVKEKFNARHMVPDDIGEQIDLCVTDVSFISLTKILPPLFSVLKPDGHIICLVKPQFELERDEIGKGGIVRDPELHQKAVDKIRNFVTDELGHQWLEHTTSPITGTDGNVEYLAKLSF